MRLSFLPAAVVRANARYFADQGYESPEILARVDAWLNGAEDSELQQKVAG
ncbi:MAG: hypothetical protein HYY05_06730 [Chloroflexi bacterium]|nr:hypothetical protein [Chloroflexota bacterium]